MARANRCSIGPKFVYQFAAEIRPKSSASSAGPGKVGRMNGISEVVQRTDSARGREPARLAYRLDNGSSNEP